MDELLRDMKSGSLLSLVGRGKFLAVSNFLKAAVDTRPYAPSDINISPN